MKKVYLKDIAKNLNLSKTAVSLVLNNKGDKNKISKETQKRIIEYAQKHNYKPNQLARGLSRGKSETIGLIIPNISDVFYAKIASRVEKKAKEYGYTVIFSSSGESSKNEQELIGSMINRQVDGLIIASTQRNQIEIHQLKDAKFPFVLIDRHYPNIDTNYVIVDNFVGISTMTQLLLNNGRRKIGFITIESKLDAIEQRLLGYKNTLKDNGIEVEKAYIKKLNHADYLIEMRQAILDLTVLPKGLDAIVFSTHYLTASGLRELRLFDCKVPEDVAIVSFDEMSAFDLVAPPITSIIQPVNEIGDSAVEILIHEINGEKSNIKKRRKLNTELIIRKSCDSGI